MKKSKNNILMIFFVLVLLGIVGFTLFNIFLKAKNNQQNFFETSTATIPSEVITQGTVVSKKQEALHFSMGGRVVYLPYQEGDSVKAGEVLASLDATDLQANILSAQANYQSAQASLNKVLDDIHLYQYGNGGQANVGSTNETQTQKTQRQVAENTVNAAYDNWQRAQKDLTSASLIAPFDGILVHEDISNTGVNVTPANVLVVADPAQLVFQVQIPDTEMANIHEGAQTNIILDGRGNQSLSGTVSKIYPEKVILGSGGTGYKVDIESADLANYAVLGSTGRVLIQSDISGPNPVVPSWTVLGHQYVWILENKKPVLKKVKVGEQKDGLVAILEGLKNGDQVIINPESLIKGSYQII